MWLHLLEMSAGGVAETIAGVDGCLYMRVRGNSESGESLSFKLRNRQTGEVRDVEGVQISFEANKAIGMPSVLLFSWLCRIIMMSA